MKTSPSRRGFLAVVLAGACLLPAVSTAATTVVGSGADYSYLVLESPNLGTRTYEIHYTYIPGGTQDAYFLLSQVTGADASYSISYDNSFGTPSAPNYFISSINGEAGKETSPGSGIYLYWSHWVAGGKGFQDSNWNYDEGDVPDGAWSVGYGVSTHFIEPGSWDALS